MLQVFAEYTACLNVFRSMRRCNTHPSSDEGTIDITLENEEGQVITMAEMEKKEVYTQNSNNKYQKFVSNVLSRVGVGLI